MLVIISLRVGLMSLAGHGPKSRSRHVCLIIASNGRQGPVLYKGDKDTAHPLKGGLAEAGGPFSLKSAIGFDTPSSTNARQPS